MAAEVQTPMVNITVNDIPVSVPKGELIVEAVKRLGLEIPIFCYHPRMKPVGMCRMCLVSVGTKGPDGSVRMMPKPQAGCTLPASEGLVIYTDTESIQKDRKGVLEFLLVNHPLDCPICDRGGECPLQNNTLAYGPSTSRFTELKRRAPKAFPLSQYVTLDLERCIQCGRCVRFTEEISGDHQLAFRFRGAEMQPSTFQLTAFESRFSGNVIEICPVGALTSAKYRFRARPWDLETKPGLCTITPDGTNVWFDTRSGKLVRLNGRTNEAVNEEWTSDKTKFGHDFYNSPSRLKAPNIRSGEGFKGASWSEAYQAVLPAFQSGSCAVLTGTNNISSEGLYMLQKLFRKGFGSSSIDHRLGLPLQPRGRRLSHPVQTTLAELEHKPAILVFGTNLAEEAPITYLRVRKAWFKHGAAVVSAHHEPCDSDAFARVVLRYRQGAEAVVADGLAALLTGAEGPSPAQVEEHSGVKAALLEEAAQVLKAEGAAILTTYSLLGASEDAARTLHGLARDVKAGFDLIALTANQTAAMELGVLPDTLPGGAADPAPGLNAREILEKAAAGQLKALMLVNCDPLSDFPDRALAEAALEKVETLVVVHHQEVEACAYATAVLPAALPAEQDGTYVNWEGRIQRMPQILAPAGESKAPWRIFTELLLRVKPATPAFNPREVMEEIASSVPFFAEARYENLGGEGLLSASVKPEPVGAA